ncbi:hypothetical protein N9F11_00325 [Akkermansiaceae bacterium]|nr:hypothetical protein [Akkermansiaceae bacterium]
MIFNVPILVILTLIAFLIIKIHFKYLLVQSNIFEMVFLFWLFILFSLNNLYLRFSNKDIIYAKLSFLKVILFLCCIIFVGACGAALNFRSILLSLLVAHLPVAFSLGKTIIINWKIRKKTLGEFSRLSFYGFCTALLSGVDKIVIVSLGYSYEDLGFYAYALAFASLPSFIVEAVKQYLSPRFYDDLANRKDYSAQTIFLLSKFLVGLIVLQFTLPFVSFEVLKTLNIVNTEFVRSDDFFLLLTILNFGFSFHIIYHFLNPYMFFYDRSGYLLVVQCCSIVLFTTCLYFSKSLSDELIALIRAFMFLLVFVFTAFPLINKRLKQKYVFQEL